VQGALKVRPGNADNEVVDVYQDAGRWPALAVICLASVVAVGGCSTKRVTPTSVQTTASTSPLPSTSAPVPPPTRYVSPTIRYEPPTTKRAQTAPTLRSGGAGIVEGDFVFRHLGPDLPVCATWEDDLKNPPADAPSSYRATTLQRLSEGGCPGYR